MSRSMDDNFRNDSPWISRRGNRFLDDEDDEDDFPKRTKTVEPRWSLYLVLGKYRILKDENDSKTFLLVQRIESGILPNEYHWVDHGHISRKPDARIGDQILCVLLRVLEDPQVRAIPSVQALLNGLKDSTATVKD